jgi:nucleoside-diphosphate-sugar epimerase
MDMPIKSQNQYNTSSQSNENNAILVTGGAGYVGSILLRRLLQQGYQVICLDCLRYGGRSLVEIWDDPHFLFYNVDITRAKDIKNIFLQHLAAIVGDPACKLEPELARKTNLDASMNLAELAKKYHVPRFVFASTCSNYGKMKDSNGFVDETSPLNPISLYAELKVAFENFLLNLENRVPGFYPTVLRFSTVYGMSPRMRFDLTVNEFTKEIALGRELTVFGENYWRPYCHVGDFSRAILAVLNAPLESITQNVFNVGDTTQNYTKKMIVDELLKHVPEANVRYVQAGEDPRDYRVIFDKIRKVLGFQISKTVPEGISDVLSCIRMKIIDNPDDQRYYNIPVPR